MKTHLNRADLTGCRVYGVAAWDLDLEETKQEALIVSPAGEPTVTVDDIEVAQFIYFMLNNEKIRRMIDSITSKAVLILGRFTKERKAVLDALRDELRKRDYLPIIFDFEKPTDRDFTETIKKLSQNPFLVIPTDPRVGGGSGGISPKRSSRTDPARSFDSLRSLGMTSWGVLR